MRPSVVVVLPRRFDFAPRVVHQKEVIHIAAFIAQSAVERLHERVFVWFFGPYGIELDVTSPGLILEHLGHEFGAVVHYD